MVIYALQKLIFVTAQCTTTFSYNEFTNCIILQNGYNIFFIKLRTSKIGGKLLHITARQPVDTYIRTYIQDLPVQMPA